MAMRMGGFRYRRNGAVLGGPDPTHADFANFRTPSTRSTISAPSPPVLHIISDKGRSPAAAQAIPLHAPPPLTTPPARMSRVGVVRYFQDKRVCSCTLNLVTGCIAFVIVIFVARSFDLAGGHPLPLDTRWFALLACLVAPALLAPPPCVLSSHGCAPADITG